MNSSYLAGEAIKVFFEEVTLWDDHRVKRRSSDNQVEESIPGSRVSTHKGPGVGREHGLLKKL